MENYFRIIIVFCFLALYSCKENESGNFVFPKITKVEKKPNINLTKTSAKGEEALKFCRKNNYNTDFCILADMSLHSGVYRLFVWDFKKKKISNKYLVGHGCGSNSWSRDYSKNSAKFSNEDGSHLSALGKYRLGERGYSDWGIHVKYLMYGLEKSNDNALKRTIVFHSWDKMCDEEVFPKGSPEGWGCPTVSNNALKDVDVLLAKSKKNVLFWMYD